MNARIRNGLYFVMEHEPGPLHEIYGGWTVARWDGQSWVLIGRQDNGLYADGDFASIGQLVQQPMDTITVNAVLRGLGLHLVNGDKWGLGARVSEAWRAAYKVAPQLINEVKADGSQGSHGFASYPRAFIPAIRRIIARLQTEDAAQLSLLPPNPEPAGSAGNNED